MNGWSCYGDKVLDSLAVEFGSNIYNSWSLIINDLYQVPFLLFFPHPSECLEVCKSAKTFPLLGSCNKYELVFFRPYTWICLVSWVQDVVS